MSKILIGLAAAGVTAMLALPAPAVANERPGDGVRNVEQMEFSARRRGRRVVRHFYGPRRVYHRSWYRPYRYAYWPRYSYYRPYYASYGYPYYSYAYSPYYYSPWYYRRGPHFAFGPFGFSIGFGF
jgi:hypothetical protein